MQYSDIQSNFSALLNRRDATTAQIQSWITSGVGMVQRELRCPAMEKSVTVTIDGTYSGGLPIPADFLELISLFNSDGKRLVKKDITDVNYQAIVVDKPIIYERRVAKWVLGPTPAVADTVSYDYYATLTPMVNNSDTNQLTTVCPELLWYAGLTFAGVHFSDKRLPGWQQTYQTIRDDLQSQSDADELSGAVAVNAAFSYQDDYFPEYGQGNSW